MELTLADNLGMHRREVVTLFFVAFGPARLQFGLGHIPHMKVLHTIISAFRRMPSGVRFVTALSMVLTLFFPLACVPVGEQFVGGNYASFLRFWWAGGGFLLAFIGLVGSVLSYGLIRAQRWSRPLVVGVGWSLVVATVIGQRGISAEGAFGFLLFGCLPSWYFYFSRPVRAYFGFTGENEAAQQS